MRQAFFGHQHPGRLRLVTLRRSKHHRMARRAERLVGTVKLEACRAMTAKPMSADLRFAKPLEHPACPRLPASFIHGIMRADEVALRGKTDPDQILGRPAIAPPKTAILTIELIIVFARLRSP